MTVVRGFGLNGKSYYTNVSKPTDVNLQFTVTPTNGLGITSLKSNGYVRNVFMHTSTTPGVNDGYTNPNPLAGFALVQFTNNFNKYLSGFVQVQAPTTGSIKVDNSALTAGQAYVITTLGNATAAQWTLVGVPAGITPAVGVSFIATSVGAGSNAFTSRVSTPTTAGVFSAEVVGDPTMSIASANIASNGGAWVLMQFMGGAFTGSALGTHTHNLLLKDAAVADGATTRVNAGTNLLGANTGSDITVAGSGANGGIVAASAGTPAGTLALSVTAPATGSVIQATFKFDASTVTIDGL